jgi:cell shape-determining protein MreC
MYPLMTDVTRLYSTVLLSKGFKDGVEKDAYVYVRGMQPVCVIKEVYTSTSLCELISASGIKTDVVIEGGASSTIAITLLGRGGGVFLGDVARDTPVSKGDKVYLKSNPSMLLGTVVDVLNNNQDTSWRIFVNGAYNPVTSSIFYIRKSK